MSGQIVASLLSLRMTKWVRKWWRGWHYVCSNTKNAKCLLIKTCLVKGCGMGPWLVLVSPCFRENVVATCKLVSFLCSLDNLLQKNVIVVFFGNQISKWRSFEKKGFLTYFSHFLVTRGKLQKFLQNLSQTHTYTYFAHPIDSLPYQFWKKNMNLSGTVSLESWCWFLFAPFWNNQ